MSLGLGHGRKLDPAEGAVGIAPADLPPLPDDLLTNPAAARLDPRAWFEHPDRPFEIEIGPGKGAFLLEHGSRCPDLNLLGIEWAGEVYAYAADRVRRRRAADGSLANVRVLRADATEFLRWRVPDAIARTIHLYFSDPWPKTKHHKNRVVQHAFLREAWRVLEPAGHLRVVTDHDQLWSWCRAHFDAWTRPLTATPSAPAERADLPDPPFEEAAFERPVWAVEGELLGTNYERKFRKDAGPHATVLRKLV